MRKSLPIAVAAALSLSLLGCSDSTSAPASRPVISVFLQAEVTDTERTAVEQRLRDMPGLRDVSHETSQQAYEKFKQQFQDADPDLVSRTEPDSLPESFRASITSDALLEPIETVAAAIDGVESVAVTPTAAQSTTMGTVVQISRDLSGDGRAAIEQAIHALPSASDVTFESSEAGYARLRKACRDEPKLAGALTQDLVLPSYRFTFALGSGTLPATKLDSLPGVVAVLTVPTSVL